MSSECAKTCPYIAWAQNSLDRYERAADELPEILSGAVAIMDLPDDVIFADIATLGEEGAILFHATGDMVAAHEYASARPELLEILARHAAAIADATSITSELMESAQNTCHGPRSRRAILGLVGQISVECTAPGMTVFRDKYQSFANNNQPKE